eukprot:312322-Pyramimonas_sp.AAC.2
MQLTGASDSATSAGSVGAPILANLCTNKVSPSHLDPLRLPLRSKIDSRVRPPPSSSLLLRSSSLLLRSSSLLLRSSSLLLRSSSLLLRNLRRNRSGALHA